jgi:four helix bundle protein
LALSANRLIANSQSPLAISLWLYLLISNSQASPKLFLPIANSQQPNNNMRNFRNLEIWKRSIELSKEIYRITSHFPAEERYGITSQMQRASVSIASNIAEGASRKSEVDFARFLEMAIESAFEVETQLIIACGIGYIKPSEQDKYIQNL